MIASTSVRSNHSTSLVQRRSRTCFALFALWKWPGWRVRNLGRRGRATEWQSRSTFAIRFAFKDPLHSTEPRGFSHPSKRTPTCPSFRGFRWGVASRSRAIRCRVEFLVVLATDPSRRNSPGGHVHPLIASQSCYRPSSPPRRILLSLDPSGSFLLPLDPSGSFLSRSLRIFLDRCGPRGRSGCSHTPSLQLHLDLLQGETPRTGGGAPARRRGAAHSCSFVDGRRAS